MKSLPVSLAHPRRQPGLEVADAGRVPTNRISRPGTTAPRPDVTPAPIVCNSTTSNTSLYDRHSGQEVWRCYHEVMHDDKAIDGTTSDWEFYADTDAVDRYIAHRESGLSANSLLEEPAFLSLLNNVKIRDCLDLGCGYGYYSELLADMGACVTAVDRAPLMIKRAKDRSSSTVTYSVADVETVTFPGESFDTVISNLVFHYIDDLSPVFRRVFQWLRPNGQFVFSVEHPVITATIDQSQWKDRDEPLNELVVSDYFSEGERWGPFGRRYHHTLETWVRESQMAGFTLTGVVEPSPSPADLELVPEFAQYHQWPVFLLVSCRKVDSAG